MAFGSLLSIVSLNFCKSSSSCCSGFSPNKEATAAPIAPAGGVYGLERTNQFKDIQPELETLKFETDENNRNIVTVHQIIKDLQGNTLADATVHQIFTIEDGLISV